MATSSAKNTIRCLIILRILICTTTTVNAVNCPPQCKCSWVLDSLELDCSHRHLKNYPHFNNLPIDHLDLSHNNFTEFPTQLADIESLIYLDLSHNHIEYLETNALLGFIALRTLLLTNNSIQSWENLNPNAAFRNAISLQHLSLSENQLQRFTDADPKERLISESLNQLDLQHCDITAVGGDNLVNGLPNLEHLKLSGNTLTTISTLPSKSLRELELSNCNLQRITSHLLSGLPNLEVLNLSWNTALQLEGNSNGPLMSDTLNVLDVSFCNLDEINLSGLPSLVKIQLRGNMLRSISDYQFANNTQVEVIDLARNSLRHMEGNAFSRLKRLSIIDLSYNEIARLDRNLFRSNDVLVSLNLSRNVIEKFTKLVSNSLRDINLSWCEIISIDMGAFTGLSSVQSLDLSNNLIRDFPGGMRSETLQKLDLSNCRLSTIRNNTFRTYPELASLHLNGNRLTNPFAAEIFRYNKFLDQIWLGDNPWICNCHDPVFMDFYDFLTTKPQKLKDKAHVRCASPSHCYGQLWESACYNVWTPSHHTNSAEKVWTIILISIVMTGILLFAISCCQKYLRNRKEEDDEREYRRNQEEMMEIRRQNQHMLEEEGAPNAPNAFETNLPSYEDAIRMPKLVRPVKSMVDLTASARTRKKLRRSRTDPEEDADPELILDIRQHFRSEEMLSNRDVERCAQIDPCRRTARTIQHNNTSGSRQFSIEESRFPPAHIKSQNLQSAEQIGNFQSYENSPYTKRKPKVIEIPPFRRASLRADSVEFLTDPEFEANSKPSSPFARRRPKFAINVDENDSVQLAPAVEDHFGSGRKSNGSTSTVNESDFQVLVVEPEITSLPDQSTTSDDDVDLESGKRKRRKNSSSRRASGNFTANAVAAAAEETSSDDEVNELDPIVVVHKPMRKTPF